MDDDLQHRPSDIPLLYEEVSRDMTSAMRIFSEETDPGEEPG